MDPQGAPRIIPAVVLSLETIRVSSLVVVDRNWSKFWFESDWTVVVEAFKNASLVPWKVAFFFVKILF